MRRPYAIGTFALFFFTLAIASGLDEIETWLGDLNLRLVEGIQRSSNIMVPMRDGVRLATSLYLPVDENERYPVIYIRTTYGGFQFHRIKHFVNHGYAVIVQHVRGRHASEGRYKSPYWTAGRDGYDTIDWVISQPWSNGKVGTFGCSYLGETQIMLAAENHPNHVAMIASGAGGAIGKAQNSYGYFGVFENGVLNLASSVGWFTSETAKRFKVPPRPNNYQERMRAFMDHLPVSEIAQNVVPYETSFEAIVSHSLSDSWWDVQNTIHPTDTFSTAGLHINDWFDQTVHDTFRLAEHIQQNATHPRAQSQHVVIAPGLHCGAGKLKPGEVTIGKLPFHYEAKNFGQLYIDWFDYWLKDKSVELPAPFQFFTVHSGHWDSSNVWPPVQTNDHRYYFRSNNRLERASGEDYKQQVNGVEFHEYTYDPRDPVPTLGGSICCTYRPDDKPGPHDQTPLTPRQDVLIYMTDQLPEDVELIGNAKVVLHVSTSALDTDFTVKMIDEFPDGRAFNLQDGVFRMRYRKGIENPSLVEPNRIYRIELELRPIAYRFQKGHKIGFHISSSNFPRLARNLNTGAHEYNDADMKVATNRVYLRGKTLSFVELPIRSRNSRPSNIQQQIN